MPQRLGNVAFERSFRDAVGGGDVALGDAIDPMQQDDMAVDIG